MNYKKLKKITLLLVLFCTQIILANNLQITNVTKVDNNTLSFDVSWDNTWTIGIEKDGVWLFIKYKDASGQWHHLDLTNVSTNGLYRDFLPTDKKGIIVFKSAGGGTTASGTVTVSFDGSSIGVLPDFKVFGIEMVRVTPGAFYLGDGVSTNRFYQGNDNTLPYHVTSYNAITVGNTANDIKANASLTSNIPYTYPKGYKNFYLMKYEVSAEQYVDFLNTLTPLQQQSRTRSDLSNITAANRFVMANYNTLTTRRNPIACDANVTYGLPITFYCDFNNNGVANESDDGQNIALTFATANDCLAYLEWAGLRPMTDMEFEKATRGPANPIPYDIANGYAYFISRSSITNSGTESESVGNVGTNGLVNLTSPNQSPIRTGALATATTTRLQSGASYYGILDLTGNVKEFCVYTEDNSLSYTRSMHGSGELDANGLSTTWNGVFQKYLYKGGSFYENNTNTHAISNSVRNITYNVATDLDNMNLYARSTQGIRGCR